MQSAEPVLDVQPRLCRGKVAGEPGDRKRSCRGSGEGALEKGLERHLAGVPISPRSKRTRASRRGRHRISRPRRPSSIPACPTAFSTQEFPCARCPLLREPGGNSCGKDFHAPNLAPPTTSISLCCFSLGCGVAPDDDVRPRDRRQRCANRTNRGCRRKREKSPRAASLWMLAEEPDLDPARVPEATRAPIRRHRRRDRNRLDGVGDQPPPRPQPLRGFAQLVDLVRTDAVALARDRRVGPARCARHRGSWRVSPRSPGSRAGPTIQARRAAGSCHRDPRWRVRSPRPPRGSAACATRVRAASAVAEYARTASSTIASTRSALTAARRWQRFALVSPHR